MAEKEREEEQRTRVAVYTDTLTTDIFATAVDEHSNGICVVDYSALLLHTAVCVICYPIALMW